MTHIEVMRQAYSKVFFPEPPFILEIWYHSQGEDCARTEVWLFQASCYCDGDLHQTIIRLCPPWHRNLISADMSSTSTNSILVRYRFLFSANFTVSMITMMSLVMAVRWSVTEHVRLRSSPLTQVIILSERHTWPFGGEIVNESIWLKAMMVSLNILVLC